MNSVCDWRGRGGVPSETFAADKNGKIHRFQQDEKLDMPGLMTKLVDNCESQLASVYSQNIGVIRFTQTLDGWLELIEDVIGHPLSVSDRERWTNRFAPFYTDFDRQKYQVNEGGFAIRLADWMTRRIQRKWYLELYGKAIQSDNMLPPPSLENTEHSYRRPALPPANMGAPPTPSILPFHTVCRLK